MQRLDVPSFAPCPAPALAKGEICLWLWRDADSDPPRNAARAKAHQRRTLAELLDTEANGLEFATGAYGKPLLSRPDAPHFNLSHSGVITALALAYDVDVGVDVEQPRRRRDVLALAQRYFAPGEAATLARLPVLAREAAFYALWTCKEAVLKALGRGIAFGLHRLEFELDADGMPRALARIDAEGGDAAAWWTCRFTPLPGAFGALAWRGPALRVRGIQGDVLA